MTDRITIINESTVLTDAQIQDAIPDLQTQISRDFNSAWGIDAVLDFLSKSQTADPNTLTGAMNQFWCVIFDTSDQACFTGDTKVSLMNGTEVSFKELVEKYSDKQFFVYSYDIENQKIVPGLAHSPRITKQNAKLVEIILDNNEKIRCTPDHKFLMRDGIYKEAQFLKENDSLMPLYRRVGSKNKVVAYELCHAGNSSKEKFTHAISAELTAYEICNICGVNLPERLQELQFNHKVKSVKFLNYMEDVYDITVEKYHNFALTSGIFVHNSALGYHDLNPAGMPMSKVFAKSDIDYGTSWTVTISHELLEMLADPFINLSVHTQTDQGQDIWVAYEVCDAPENDQYGYIINKTLVSDFVYPAWFEDFRQPGSTKFDQCGNISAPFQLIPGGYIGVYDPTQGGWTQITAQQAHDIRRPKVVGDLSHPIITHQQLPKIGSRRERRSRPRQHWLKSK